MPEIFIFKWVYILRDLRLYIKFGDFFWGLKFLFFEVYILQNLDFMLGLGILLPEILIFNGVYILQKRA